MKPAVFVDLSLEAARTRAKEEGRVLLVNVVAKESAECQAMDRTTWSDPRVAERIAAAAIAIQVDVEADAMAAKMMHVASTPAIVAQDRGGYVDHVERSMTPEELLAWFDEVALGETYRERRRRDVAANPADTFRRLQLAGDLHDDGAFDEATAEYVWLWKHMLEHEPKMADMKHLSVAGSLRRLVDAHPPARDAFAALRAPSPPSLDVPDAIPFADWWSLNRILDEDAKTLAWFDAHRERALAATWLAEAIMNHLEPLLIEANRWSDVALLHADPVTKFKEDVTRRAQVLAEMAAMAAMPLEGVLPASATEFMRFAANEQLRGAAYKLVRSLRAAGRDDEAKQIADAAAAADDSAEMAAALEGRYTTPDPKVVAARFGR